MGRVRSEGHGVLVALALGASATALAAGSVPASAALRAGSVSPLPGAAAAAPRTDITFRRTSAGRLAGIRVTGSRSGRHAGRILAGPDGAWATFHPARPFTAGERVSVQTGVDVPGARNGDFAFTISPPIGESGFGGVAEPRGNHKTVQNVISRPEITPARLQVKTGRGRGTGDLFLAPKNGIGRNGPAIYAPNGSLVWFKPVSFAAFDFRVQRYRGRAALTWWEGGTTIGRGRGVGYIFDASYRRIAKVRAGNSYQADLHEFRLTPRGTALVTAYDLVYGDLSSVGGRRRSPLLDSIVQEVDVRTSRVLFEWHSLGHVRLPESHVAPEAGVPYDYFHVNSVDLDADGNLLVSGRNTWGVYKIDRATGRVIWRLGGKRSSFRQGANTRTAFQHDAKRQADGTLTIFDNGSSPQVHKRSRAVRIRLDEARRTATFVAEVDHPRRLVANSQGNAQTLGNRNLVVGWGDQPYVSEFAPSGKILFDARFPDAANQSYRAYRFDWTGRPGGRPAFALRRATGHPVTAFASWNGATEVARWELLAGADPGRLVRVASAARRDFETAVRATSRQRWFAVRALDGGGRVLGTSRARR